MLLWAPVSSPKVMPADELSGPASPVWGRPPELMLWQGLAQPSAWPLEEPRESWVPGSRNCKRKEWSVLMED